MKASKSKGRITEVIPRPPPPQTQRRSRRVRRAKGPQNPRRVITVHYLKKKVNFTVTHLDPTLGRALVLAFGNTNYKLTQSSLLLELKANWTRLENTYAHTLDLKQALNLYTSLMRKRRGEASPMKQLEELEAILKSYVLESKDLEGDLETERIEINREIEQVRRAIKTIYVKMREDLKKNFQTSEDYFKASLLEWKIRQLGCDLVNLMIVAILEVDIDKVDIIFQHPYPERSCSRSYLIRFLGEERYNAKKIDFVRHYRTARIHSCRNTNFIVCHMCRQPITDVYLRCHKKHPDPLEPTIYNSPNVYERHLLSVDYLYTNFDEVLTQKQLDEELDYFKYSQNLAGRYACNRFICVECMEKHVILNNADQVLNYTCQFCSHMCLCQGCVMAQQLVKALALYKQILKNNYQELDDYYQLVKFVNLDHESVEAFLNTRSSFQAPFNKQYEYLYYSGIDEFGNIDQVMTKMQSEAVRCFPLLADTSMMISNYMAQVRQFILSERSQLQINPLPSGRKYLSRVREENKRYEQLLEDRKERDRFEELCVQRRLPARVKEFRMKLRIITASYQSQQGPLYEAPFEPYDISQEEMFIDMETDEATQELVKGFKPLQPEEVKRIIVAKTEIPFDESDYQIAINVKPECKIPDENEIYLQKALEEKILYPDNHKVYGFRATKISRFHEDAEEFCDLLEDSDTSEEDDDSLDDLQLEKAPSVSVSSFLGPRCQVEDYRVADDIDDVSNYDSANSSFIFIEQQPFPPSGQEPNLNREEDKEDKEGKKEKKNDEP